MTGSNTMAQEMERIFARLRELGKSDFPHCRSYRRPDGTWADREPTQEYLEQEELIRKWRELQKIGRYFHAEHNPLLISLRLNCIADSLVDDPAVMDIPLLTRIALSVYRNADVN